MRIKYTIIYPPSGHFDWKNDDQPMDSGIHMIYILYIYIFRQTQTGLLQKRREKKTKFCRTSCHVSRNVESSHSFRSKFTKCCQDSPKYFPESKSTSDEKSASPGSSRIGQKVSKWKTHTPLRNQKKLYIKRIKKYLKPSKKLGLTRCTSGRLRDLGTYWPQDLTMTSPGDPRWSKGLSLGNASAKMSKPTGRPVQI